MRVERQHISAGLPASARALPTKQGFMLLEQLPHMPGRGLACLGRHLNWQYQQAPEISGDGVTPSLRHKEVS